METDLSSQDRKDLDKFIKFFALKVTYPFSLSLDLLEITSVLLPFWKYSITACSLPILMDTLSVVNQTVKFGGGTGGVTKK